MSVIGDSRRPDGAGPGILPLRHAGYNQQGITLDMRSCVLGIEVEKREERGPGMGFYSYTERSVGDLIGGMIWNLDMAQDEIRALPPWRFSFPSMVEADPKRSPGDDPTPIGVRPLRLLADGWTTDARLPMKSDDPTHSSSPSLGDMRWWPKFPDNWVGITMAVNREDKQESVFLPTDPRLVAANLGDEECGSLVYDVIADRVAIHRAPLQGIMRVLPGPFAGPCVMEGFQAPVGDSILALQIGWSGARDIRGGFFFNETTGGAVSAGDLGGPFEVGLPNGEDPHFLFKDSHAHGINSMAISLDAFFSPPGGSAIFNAPKKWDGRDDTEPKSGKVWREVKHVWTPNLSHRHPCTQEEIEGMHHWIAACVADHGQPYETTEDEPSPSGTPMTPPGSLPPPPPASGGIQIGPIPDPGPNPWGVENIAFVPVSLAMGEGGAASVESLPQPVTESNIFREYNQIYSETAMPGLLARPQMHKTGVADLRNWEGSANEGIDPKPYQVAFRRSSPIVARLEAFGQQGASNWVYTHGLNAGGRYAPSPTADGGWVFTPPESSILQVEDNDQPSTVSNSYLIFAPNTRLGFGRPLMSTGSMTSGISIEVDGTNNRLKGYTETTGTRAHIFTVDADVATVTAGKGFIVKTPDGTKSYRIRVDNSGNVATDLIS